ncbi:MAG: Exonuclease small subunit [Acidimicrobiaceae bacterium]|nr:Exonuclease small subunit [Acidimicrobiaceae bacterium]
MPEPPVGNGGGGGLVASGEAEQMTFEQLVAALEALTDQLASGQIGIEEAADLYEQAERLHGLATQRLAKVQARIEALGVRPTGT